MVIVFVKKDIMVKNVEILAMKIVKNAIQKMVPVINVQMVIIQKEKIV